MLGKVCDYLEEPDVKRLMCTCRAMPSGLASARAERMEDEKKVDLQTTDRTSANAAVDETDK